MSPVAAARRRSSPSPKASYRCECPPSAARHLPPSPSSSSSSLDPAGDPYSIPSGQAHASHEHEHELPLYLVSPSSSFSIDQPIIGNFISILHQLFKEKHLNLDPKEENEKFLTFLIHNESEGLLMNFFFELEERAEEFGISDIQLGPSIPEKVFLNIAKQAELESAAAEGDLVLFFFLNSRTSIQVHIYKHKNVVTQVA